MNNLLRPFRWLQVSWICVVRYPSVLLWTALASVSNILWVGLLLHRITLIEWRVLNEHGSPFLMHQLYLLYAVLMVCFFMSHLVHGFLLQVAYRWLWVRLTGAGQLMSWPQAFRHARAGLGRLFRWVLFCDTWGISHRLMYPWFHQRPKFSRLTDGQRWATARAFAWSLLFVKGKEETFSARALIKQAGVLVTGTWGSSQRVSLHFLAVVLLARGLVLLPILIASMVHVSWLYWVLGTVSFCGWVFVSAVFGAIHLFFAAQVHAYCIGRPLKKSWLTAHITPQMMQKYMQLAKED